MITLFLPKILVEVWWPRKSHPCLASTKVVQKKKAVQPVAAVPARVVPIPRNNNVARLPAGGVGSPPVRQQRNMRMVARRRREQREAPLPDEPVVPPVAVPPEPEQAAVAGEKLASQRSNLIHPATVETWTLYLC